MLYIVGLIFRHSHFHLLPPYALHKHEDQYYKNLLHFYVFFFLKDYEIKIASEKITIKLCSNWKIANEHDVEFRICEALRENTKKSATLNFSLCFYMKSNTTINFNPVENIQHSLCLFFLLNYYGFGLIFSFHLILHTIRLEKKLIFITKIEANSFLENCMTNFIIEDRTEDYKCVNDKT